jgi:hypothetical protein
VLRAGRGWGNRPVTPRPHRLTRRDANQAEIVDGLRAMGAFVEDISATCAWGDILVYWYDLNAQERIWRVFELKTPTGRLTEAEQAMQDEWPGAVPVARSLAEVAEAFGWRLE